MAAAADAANASLRQCQAMMRFPVTSQSNARNTSCLAN
jgi:hypothetical protein